MKAITDFFDTLWSYRHKVHVEAMFFSDKNHIQFYGGNYITPI